MKREKGEKIRTRKKITANYSKIVCRRLTTTTHVELGGLAQFEVSSLTIWTERAQITF